ncbi:hypothetical protein GEMRC1_010747 [Eukaryota sp. GEM-RC1]
MKRPLGLKLQTTLSANEVPISETGTLKLDDVLINADGVRFLRKSKEYTRPRAMSNSEQEEEGLFPNVIKLNDLETIKIIGRGAQGTVRLARHLPSDKLVALKEVRCNLTDKTVRRQILRELHLLFEMSSPFIVPCFGFFFAEHAINVASEFMNGGSLARHHFGFGPELRCIARSLVSGLAHLEKCHLLHRDIKPDNLLATTEGVVKIADFGLTVKTKDGIVSMASFAGTFAGGYGGDTFVGSVAYMSPERIVQGKCYFASDLWSAGLSLLELGMGEYPYKFPENEGNKMIEVMDTIVSGPPPINTGSATIDDFLSKCLGPDPAKRPTSTELLQHPWLREGTPEGDQQALAQCFE